MRQHTQLADVAFYYANRKCSRNKNNGKTIAETLGTTVTNHPQLNIPNNSVDISRTFATSRIKVNEQAIIELYAYFADYVFGVIREIEGIDPNRIWGFILSQSPTDLSYKDLFTLGNK